MKIRQATLTQFGGIEHIAIQTRELSPPAPQEVRVRIEAATVSVTDTLIRKGLYPLLKQQPPFTLGYDFVGIVEAVGSDVDDVQLGERVANIVQIGGNATHINVPAKGLLRMPSDLDAVRVSALILNGMTAYQILKHHTRLHCGQTFLIHGGSGAVGSTLLQLCRLQGIRTVTTASRAKHGLIKPFADVVIDYNASDYHNQLRRAAGTGFDAAFDFTNQKSFNQSFGVLKHGGVLVSSGTHTLAKQTHRKTMWTFGIFSLDFAYLMLKLMLWNALPNGKQSRFFGIIDSKHKYPQRYQADLDELCELVRSGQLNPLIHSTLPLDKTETAHQILDTGLSFGNIVIVNQH